MPTEATRRVLREQVALTIQVELAGAPVDAMLERARGLVEEATLAALSGPSVCGGEVVADVFELYDHLGYAREILSLTEWKTGSARRLACDGCCRYRRARALRVLGRLAEAREICEEELQECGAGGSLLCVQGRRAYWRAEAARIAVSEEDLKEASRQLGAIDDCELFCMTARGRGGVMDATVQMLVAGAQVEGAEEMARSASARLPASSLEAASMWWRLGTAYASQGRWREARRFARRAGEIADERRAPRLQAEAHVLAAEACTHLGDRACFSRHMHGVRAASPLLASSERWVP